MAGRRNKRGGGGGHGGGGEERWLLPYSDMITLLLGLFIVLFAMSSVDAKKFDSVRDSLATAFKGAVLEDSGGILPGATGVVDPTAVNRDSDSTKLRIRDEATAEAQEQFAQEQQKLQRIIENAKLSTDVQVEPSERGIKITLAGDALFDTGSSDLRPAARANLAKIAAEIAAFRRPIAIEGHTDRQPHRAGRTGNYDLSQARARSVFVYFWDSGVNPSKMEAYGKGDWSPKVAYKPGGSLDVRANRRIEIYILAPGIKDAGMPAAADDVAPAAAAPRPVAAPEPTKAATRAEVERDLLQSVIDAGRTSGE